MKEDFGRYELKPEDHAALKTLVHNIAEHMEKYHKVSGIYHKLNKILLGVIQGELGAILETRPSKWDK